MLVGCLYLRHAQLLLLTYSVSYALSSHHRLNLSSEVLARRGGGWGDPIPSDTAVHLCILIAIDSSLCSTHAARSRHSTSSPKRLEYFLMIPMTCTRDSRDHRLFVRCPLRTPTNISNPAAPFKGEHTPAVYPTVGRILNRFPLCADFFHRQHPCRFLTFHRLVPRAMGGYSDTYHYRGCLVASTIRHCNSSLTICVAHRSHSMVCAHWHIRFHGALFAPVLAHLDCTTSSSRGVPGGSVIGLRMIS